MRNKYKIAFILFLFILIVFMGCTSSQIESSTNANTLLVKTESDSNTRTTGSSEVRGKVNLSEIEEEETPEMSDKCYSAQYSSYSVWETESELWICYKGKYFDYSVTMDNLTICDEIIREDYLGLCHGNFAYKKKDASICDKTPIKYYEAKGFYERLNSKDICFSYYSLTTKTNTCNKIANNQLKEKCKESLNAGY